MTEPLKITNPRAFKKGDEVVADPTFFPNASGVFVIDKVPVGAKGKNYVAVPREGNPYPKGLKGEAYCFNAYDPEKDPTGTGVVEVEYVPVPPNSSIVKVRDYPGIDPDDLYVVLGYAQRSMDAARIQKIGGDGGRYWKAIPARLLTVIDPARITVTPED